MSRSKPSREATPHPTGRFGSSGEVAGLVRGARTRRLLVALCLAIAALDLVQVALWGKGVGALGGAAIYGGGALLLLRRWTAPAWLVAAMPLVPVAVFSGVLGLETRAQLVDGGMIGVFVLQVAAAATAVATLARDRSRSGGLDH